MDCSWSDFCQLGRSGVHVKLGVVVYIQAGSIVKQSRAYNIESNGSSLESEILSLPVLTCPSARNLKRRVKIFQTRLHGDSHM
jgi:hypothetical protein